MRTLHLLPLVVTFSFGCAGGEILSPVDDGETGAEIDGPVDEPALDQQDPTGGGGANTACSDECEFTTYNLDVRTGDTFVLARFLACVDPLASHTFVQEGDGAPWRHLDAINAGEPITITDADRAGGDHGPGEYRLFLIDDVTGDDVDHMTIRIDHDDESDIDVDAAHAQPLVPGECPVIAGIG